LAQSVVGVDIGYETAKLASLARAGAGWKLGGMALAKIPVNPWKTDGLVDVDKIAAIIRQALAEAHPHPITTKRAMVALPESVIFSATFPFQDLPPHELKEALPFEIAEKLSINLEEYCFDYEEVTSKCRPIENSAPAPTKPGEKTPATKPVQPLDSAQGKSSESAPLDNARGKQGKSDGTTTKPEDSAAPTAETGDPAKRLTIFAVAAKKSLIDSLLELCEKAGLELAAIDVKPGAIARAAVKNEDGKIRLLVDMGMGGTSASILEGKSLRVTATIPWGIHAITNVITEPVENLRDKAAPVFDELVHISKFFENRICPGHKIEVIISGSGATIPNVVDVFHQETGLPVALSTPFTSVDTGRYKVPPEMAHTFADAIGLAMRVA